MSDVEKIILNGTEYEIADTKARQNSSTLLTTATEAKQLATEAKQLANEASNKPSITYDGAKKSITIITVGGK